MPKTDEPKCPRCEHHPYEHERFGCMAHIDGQECACNMDSAECWQACFRIEREVRLKAEALICSECGFPTNKVREPIFLDDNVLSLASHLNEEETMRCKTCGNWRDGTTIKETAQGIRKMLESNNKTIENLNKTIENATLTDDEIADDGSNAAEFEGWSVLSFRAGATWARDKITKKLKGGGFDVREMREGDGSV